MPTSASGVMMGGEVGDGHGRAVEDPHRRGVVGVAERGAHHEPVELRLGQPVGARLLHGVLRREHEERHPHLTRDAVDRDAPLLHHLEKGGLGLRARAVDLVGEHDVREDRAGVELEDPLLLVVHADAGDVPRQQVGSELDAGVRALHRLGHRAGERGLARSRERLRGARARRSASPSGPARRRGACRGPRAPRCPRSDRTSSRTRSPAPA